MIKTLTKIFAIATIIGSPIISIAQVAPGAGDVLISELSRYSSGYDFIELYNNTSNNITLADCKLIRLQSGSASADYIYDFNTEGSGDIIIPANGFLIVSKNSSETSFNTYWGVDLTNLGSNYNGTSNSSVITLNSYYTLKYGGTANTDDGTSIDNTTKYAKNTQRIYQAPIGTSTYEVISSVATCSPGSFEIYEDLSRWDGIFHSSWIAVTPSPSTGSSNFLVHGVGVTIADGSVVGDLYLSKSANVKQADEGVTVNGDLTLEDKAGFSISSSSGSLTVLGTTSIHVNGSGNTNAYNIWSTPLSNNVGLLSTFNSANPCDLYVFRASNQSWAYDYAVPFSTSCNGSSVTFNSTHVIASPQGTPDGNFDIGRGYFAPGNSSDATRVFSASGSPNNGTVYVPLYGSSVSAAGGNDWNLVGNPYACGISVYVLTTQNSSFFNAVYIYNSSTGLYETKNSGDGYIVAMGQGFWVDANTTTDGVIGNMRFTNLQQRRVYDTFLKTNDSNYVDTTVAYISLINPKNISDPIKVYLDDDCLDGYDRKFDARKLWNDNNFNFATLIETDPQYGPEPYVFNGIKTLTDKETKVLDLIIQTDTIGPYQIKLDSVRDMPLGVSFKLEDNLTSTMTDLRNGTYTFNSTQPDSLENRFFLHISYDASITSIDEIKENSFISIYTKSESIKITTISTTREIDFVQVFDILGKLIYSDNSNGLSISIPTEGFQSGTYIVRVVDSKGEVFNKRVVVNNL